MTIEQDIRTYVLADGTVSGLIGTRFYPLVLPQNPTLPALTGMKVSGPRLHDLDGAAGHATPRVSIHCWAETYSGAKTLAEAVRSRLDGFVGKLSDGNSPESFRRATAKLDNEIDDYEEDTELYRVIQDYKLNHAE